MGPFDICSPHTLELACRTLAEVGAVQCGFCTPGAVISAVALLARNPDPDEHEICQAVSGNLCRCTGYAKVVQAVRRSAKEMVP